MTGHTLFRWWYGGIFSILSLILLVGLVITPGDAIRQALNNGQLYNVFVIAGCYFATVVIAFFLYFSRLYTNKSVLKAIPKNWIPIEKGEVDKKVRKMIVAQLNRSAAIAWDSRPRIPQEPPTVVSEPEAKDSLAFSIDGEPEKKEGHGLFHRTHAAEKNEQVVTIPPPRPVWGDILHNGWSSPTSPDLPGLQYTTVILELPHLIEARAVSLAPVEPHTEPPLPDIRAVEILQRPAAMGLREYIGQLSSIGVLKDPSAAAEFLDRYEYARFSSRPLTEQQFRDLMRHFAELLRNMDTLSPAILTSLDIEIAESDFDDDGSSTTPVTPRSRSLASSRSVNSHEGTIRTAPSRNADTTPSKRPQEFSTAPGTPKSKKRVISRSPSLNTFAQSRRPYAASGSSSESLTSASESSVIKLSRSNTEGDLPYTLNIPRVR
ncbi:hypothetical protein EG329_013693 [Mollisiaceae sp. DMI_Dod_QoI]|nr:hypothetical protein EG329_013693 [Helotiales sp. DMI_Dod_QoI]